MSIETNFESPWIETFCGENFYLFSDCESGINIETIAHSLSMQCRFNGHCDRFYSVAEHCVYLSHIVPKDKAKEALLHDASEAYLCDLPAPFKDYIPGYRDLENQVMERIARKFGLPYGFDSEPEFKKWDVAMQFFEGRQMLISEAKTWTFEEPFKVDDMVKNCPAFICEIGMPPDMAEKFFLKRYKELFQEE